MKIKEEEEVELLALLFAVPPPPSFTVWFPLTLLWSAVCLPRRSHGLLFSGSVDSFPLRSKARLSSLGGAGVHVQPDRGHRSSDHAPGLRHGRLGGEPGAHHLPGIHEVNEGGPGRCGNNTVLQVTV